MGFLVLLNFISSNLNSSDFELNQWFVYLIKIYRLRPETESMKTYFSDRNLTKYYVIGVNLIDPGQ